MGQAFRPIALVVEDDPDQRDFVSVLLEECDMRVVSCETAETAVSLLDKYGAAVALIFTDVQLAGTMDGASLAAVAKNRFPDLMVIVTSGSGEPALPRDTKFMPKPWRALDVLREAARCSL